MTRRCLLVLPALAILLLSTGCCCLRGPGWGRGRSYDHGYGRRT